jgi:hypothetical protein
LCGCVLVSERSSVWGEKGWSADEHQFPQKQPELITGTAVGMRLAQWVKLTGELCGIEGILSAGLIAGIIRVF